MNIFKRNQVVITALVIMIAIAGYLSFTQKNVPDTADVVQTNNNKETLDFGNFQDIIPDNFEQSDVIGKTDAEAPVDAADATTDTSTDAAAVDSKTDDNLSTPGEAIFTSTTLTVNEYFVQAKFNREQARAKSKEILLEIVNNNNISNEEKKVAVQDMLTLADRIEREAAIEDMLEAKGYSNVVIRIDDNLVDVVLCIENITDVDRAKIADTVKARTNMTADKIVITPVNLKN